MSAPPFMPLYVGDYLADTTHLTVTEHGAYMLLLMSMWRNGGSLPNDDKALARHARCTRGQWDRMRPVLIEFFEATDRTITHIAIFDALTSGNMLGWAQLTTSRTINDGDVLRIPAGDLDITLT